MRIGIDISQLAYPNTGVANYLRNLVSELVINDKKNEYVLFFSSMRRNLDISSMNLQSNSRVIIKTFKYPPTLLSLIWNKFHVFPIEYLIGNVDLFITSDWSEPPVKKAKKATILYDLVVYRSPEETDEKIVHTQRRKLSWVKKESDVVFCISESTKNDAEKILGIENSKLKVIYPGL